MERRREKVRGDGEIQENFIKFAQYAVLELSAAKTAADPPMIFTAVH